MQGLLSSYFELGVLIPDILKEKGNNIITISEGGNTFLSPNIETKVDLKIITKQIENRMQQNYYTLMNLLPKIDIDIFISFIGEYIPLDLVNEMSKQGTITINWDENDPYPDDKREDGVITFWKKSRAYDVLWGAHRFTPNWLPLAAYTDIESYHVTECERNIDLGFIGNTTYETRVKWFKTINDAGLNVFRPNESFIDYRQIKNFYSHTKIVPNTHKNSTINGRVFEATANGALLITDYAPGLEDCFEFGKEIILMENDGIEQIKYFLENDDERKKIAKAGFERTIKDHKMEYRLDKMIEDSVNGNVWKWRK